MESGELLTVQQVATRLKLHPETIRRWLRDGHLRGVRFGGSGGYRIPETELRRLLDEQMAAGDRRANETQRDQHGAQRRTG